MLLIDSPVGFLLGTIALAMAAPFVAAAALEDARCQGWPLPMVAFAWLWSLVFVTSAVLMAVDQGQLAAAGLLGAAAELAAAAGVWGLRCRRTAPGEDGGSGPRHHDPRRVGPADGDAVDWELWERQFDREETSCTARSSGRT